MKKTTKEELAKVTLTKKPLPTTESGYKGQEPLVLELPNGLKLGWGDDEVKIEVTRLHAHKDDKVSGEIRIKHGMFKTPERKLHTALFNFNSTTTRAHLARALEAKVDSVDWSETLEQLCDIVMEYVRMGEPSVLLQTETEYTPPEYLLYPVLLQNEPNVIFGDGESGKSILSLILTLMVQLPHTHNTLGLTPIDASTKVLYLDWETNDNTTGWRYKCLSAGLDLPPMELEYRRCSHTLYDDIDAISRLISETGAKLIIIDSVAAAAGGDTNTTTVANEFYGALRRLKVTSLLLGHTSKDKSKDTEKTLYGNAFFTNYARMIWHAVRVSAPGADTISVVLHHQKANYTKHHTPIGFNINFNQGIGRITVSALDTLSDYPTPIDMGLSDRIWQALHRGSMTAGELARSAGANRVTVDVTLLQMKRAGDVIALPGLRWGLQSEEYNAKLVETVIDD